MGDVPFLSNPPREQRPILTCHQAVMSGRVPVKQVGKARRAIRAGQSLEEAIAATPLGQQYTRDTAGSNSPLLPQFVAFRAGIHRWNVWRTYQGMKGDPTYRGPEAAYAATHEKNAMFVLG